MERNLNEASSSGKLTRTIWELQQAIQKGDSRLVLELCSRIEELEQRIRADCAMVQGELKVLEQRCRHQKMTTDKLESLFFETRDCYTQSLTVFERFRRLIADMQRLRSLGEFPAFLLELKSHLDVDSLELALRAELCDEFVSRTIRTVPGAELEQAISLLSGKGYLGPVGQLPLPEFFLGEAGKEKKGSCYVHPLDNKYDPQGHIGVLSLYSADPERYGADKATDFLSHFCELMACALVTVRDHDVLLRQSVVDPLTGVHNRMYLERHAQRLLDFSRRKGFPVSLLFIDLDDFKPVNDNLGHNAGDAILKEVGRRISNLVRDYDIFVRLGGDEFVLLCPDTDESQAAAMAVRLEQEVAAINVAECTGRETGLRISASVGVSSQTGLHNLDELLQLADAAMYASKQGIKKKAEGDG